MTKIEWYAENWNGEKGALSKIVRCTYHRNLEGWAEDCYWDKRRGEVIYFREIEEDE